MRVDEVDIDHLVDYKTEYSRIIPKYKISGDNLTGLCPFHDDKNNSFSVDLKTGCWKCHAEDRGGNFTSFYAELNGIDTKEAYKSILKQYGAYKPEEDKKPEGSLLSYSVAQYVLEKRLPEEFLKEQCCLQTKRDKQGIQYLYIPYFNENSDEVTYRKRYGDKAFRWKYGAGKDICMYGEWKLEQIRTAGYVALVEGESDSQSMWYMGISTLGIPGASMMRKEWATTLQDLKVYIHVEPDKGGETFLHKVTTALRDGNFIGQVYKWSCKNLGCKDPSDVYIKYGKEEAAQKIKSAISNAQTIDIDEESIPEALPGAPVNLRQPEGWIYSDKGISKIDEKKFTPVTVCRTPIILTQRLRSMETGEEKMEVAFKRDGTWHKAIYPRSTIFTARGITALADLGCTVTSENAKQVVKFLSALESENIDIIKKADSTSTFGWQEGKRFIPGHDKDIVLDIDPSQRALAAAYCQNGTFKDWLEMMRPHRKRDKFRFILAAGFTAPLLRIIKQRIFFVYNWGGSKGGKTAGLKAALSAWGDPERLMVNFNATQVGLERTASFYCDLPLGIDERQLAGNNQNGLEKIVYMIASGTGKIRGAKSGGIQAMHTWRTVALATGEEPLSTETSQTGVSTRVLEIYGGPFDDEREASMMHQQSAINCGWAGPAFIGMLMHTDERSITSKYDEMMQFVYQLSKGKSGSHIAGIAAVALTDAIIDTWLFEDSEWLHRYEVGEFDTKEAKDNPEALQIAPESWERAKEMARSIIKEQMDADVGDVNENATQYIIDWILSNKDSFGERVYGTCLGLIEGQEVYIFPSMLTQALTKAGYSSRKTMKYLADKNLIGTTTSKSGGTKNSVFKWFNGRQSRFVEFHLGKIVKESEPAVDENGNPMGDGWNQVPENEQMELPFD
jgi:putative CHC2 zinc finger protein|nr:MAG TPA: active helicase ring shaped helicase [Caudoviricetes sp.]